MDASHRNSPESSPAGRGEWTPGPTSVFKWTTACLVLAALLTFAPLWVPLVLAAWTAHLASPLLARLQKRLGDRKRVAGALTVLLLILLIGPMIGAAASLVSGATELVKIISASQFGRGAFEALVSDGSGKSDGTTGLHGFSVSGLLELARQHGASAWKVSMEIAGATASAGIAIFVFLLAAYAFLVNGPAVWTYIAAHSPIPRPALRRLADAFHETGRGLIIGTGLTALCQGIIATVTYLAIGVPRALVLGFFTFFAAFIPSFGTAIVWVPVMIGLALTQHYVAATVLGVVGVGVISTVDNLLRPVLARWGNLELPFSALVISIFGGFAIFGAWGILLGPLLVRLAREALTICREEGWVGTDFRVKP